MVEPSSVIKKNLKLFNKIWLPKPLDRSKSLIFKSLENKRLLQCEYLYEASYLAYIFYFYDLTLCKPIIRIIFTWQFITECILIYWHKSNSEQPLEVGSFLIIFHNICHKQTNYNSNEKISYINYMIFFVK